MAIASSVFFSSGNKRSSVILAPPTRTCKCAFHGPPIRASQRGPKAYVRESPLRLSPSFSILQPPISATNCHEGAIRKAAAPPPPRQSRLFPPPQNRSGWKVRANSNGGAGLSPSAGGGVERWWFSPARLGAGRDGGM